MQQDDLDEPEEISSALAEYGHPSEEIRTAFETGIVSPVVPEPERVENESKHLQDEFRDLERGIEADPVALENLEKQNVDPVAFEKHFYQMQLQLEMVIDDLKLHYHVFQFSDFKDSKTDIYFSDDILHDFRERMRGRKRLIANKGITGKEALDWLPVTIELGKIMAILKDVREQLRQGQATGLHPGDKQIAELLKMPSTPDFTEQKEVTEEGRKGQKKRQSKRKSKIPKKKYLNQRLIRYL